MTKKRRNIVAGDVPRAIITDVAKKLAYRFGAAAKGGSGLTLPGIIEAAVEPQIEYDELRGYIYGPESIGLKPFEGKTNGPVHSSLISSKEAKEYKGVLNPDNEYVFPEQVRPVLEAAANSGSNIYLNADDLPFTGVDRYDAANHPVRVHYDENGNIVGSAADIYDFDTGYMRRYKAPSWQVLAMKPVGEPYIVRQDNIPVRFVSDDADMEDLMKASKTMEAWGSAETPHIKKKRGELPGNIGTYHDKDSETYAIENTLKRAGVAVDDYPTYLQDYRNGGKIHISPNLYGRGGETGPINPLVISRVIVDSAKKILPKGLLVSASKLARNIGNSGGGNDRAGNFDVMEPGATFLLDPSRQRKEMEALGYKLVDDDNYGMVSRAVQNLKRDTNRNVPIYQLGDDDESLDNLEVIYRSTDYQDPYHLPNFVGSDNMLLHAGHHPYILYKDKSQNKYYYRAYDLNDYGQHASQQSGTTYGKMTSLANLYDIVGTPFVQRTGIRHLPAGDGYEFDNLGNFEAYLQGGYPLVEAINKGNEPVLNYLNTLKEHPIVVNAKPRGLSGGGKIHIKPENRGKFTALKKRTGHSASWFKAHGTPAQKKMAVFELNSRHWRHDNGGLLHTLDKGYQIGQIYDLSEEQINELIRQGYEVERV